LISTLLITALVTCLTLLPARAHAAKIITKDGSELEGDVGRLNSMIAGPKAAPNGDEVIVVLDDGLTRRYISFNQVAKVLDNAGTKEQKILVKQSIANSGAKVGSLGDYVQPPTELDRF